MNRTYFSLLLFLFAHTYNRHRLHSSVPVFGASFYSGTLFSLSLQVNTFQAVIGYDETDSYVLFLYPEGGLNFFGTRPKVN